MRVLLSLVVFSFVVTTAFAISGPSPGVYKSLGGSLMEGVFSESWVDEPHREGMAHNAIHAWDNAQGVQWRLYCPSIATVTLLVDTRDQNGNGFVQYSTDYSGGSLWLSKTGPWGHNEIDFIAIVDEFNVVSTHIYYLGSQVSVDSDIRFSGHFDPPVFGCFEYVLSNGAIEGTTGLGMQLPTGYPAFLDYYNCPSGTVSWGAWGIAHDITLTIYGSCFVPTQDTTWGGIKALFSE
ncbi:MAG: hypothetical protein EHM80_14080 [Nitrospiraceae bacterium]|nr:MAG: hypothetical protein EHM80_14080 [Nitrospiraceae bacterium]